MSARRALYSGVVLLLAPAAVLRLLWRARRQPAYLRHIGERFGFHRAPRHQACIWVHAVSVGETRAAEPLIRALRLHHPDRRILLTHMTPTGRETGRQLFGDEVDQCYVPYDLPMAVRAFLRQFRPQLGILMETELWPNLVCESAHAGVPVVLVNARLSQRSARGYARFAALTREALQALAGIAAQSQADAGRLAALGASRIEVTGNLKFDRAPAPGDLQRGAALRAMIGERFVLLCASTREGEEELILDALDEAMRTMVTVIVPRHPQRFDAVARLLQRRGIPYQRRSEMRALAPATQAVLGDSMGEMFAYYAACDLAFVGGSLLPLGGQNLLEACAVGRPVVVGPHMFNFAQATALAVGRGAALQVEDAARLADAVTMLREDAGRREAMAEAGRQLMREHQGSTARTLAFIEQTLRTRGATPATR